MNRYIDLYTNVDMHQGLALEIMLEGESVMLTGPAGSGKTYVLNEFIRRAKKQGKSVAVTATTGLAASHLGGATIHAWSGIGIHDTLPNKFFEHLTKGRRDAIEKADTLIIDEVSMLHDYRLDLVNEITKRVRGSNEPFGGLQVILCGDFFQLPPVNRDDSRAGSFVVNSEAWQELDPVICYLTEQHRQNDDDFLDILNALRAGDIRRHHAEKLLARTQAELLGDQEITELHTTNVNVDTINAARLKNIDAEIYSYQMQTTGKENYVETLKRSCLAPEELVLKKGALVMCIKNAQDRKYVNGSLGVVEDFEKVTHYPKVKLRNGKTITMLPESWELRDGDKKRASLTQIPLRLAWAITVHKSQGMTLDAARVDLRRAFVEGMGYVALSRVRSLETLSLTGINRMALKVSDEAIAIDENLRTKSAADAKRFERLEEKAAKRKSEPEKDSPASKTEWQERISKMRETYARAFMPWKPEEDEKLIALHNEKVKLPDICAALQRQPGSIEARLKKHFGEDVKVAK